MTTKERILMESLDLFSKNGFKEVSMRDIGAAVGIRQSSIYKHYSSKQDIMEAIVKMAIDEIDNIIGELEVPNPNMDTSIKKYVDMKFEDIANLCSDMVLKQRDNEIISKFRQILTMEQYRNAELQKIYTEVFIDRQLKYNEKVFEYLLNVGVLKGDSPKMMALKFYSPFFLLQYRLQDDEEELKIALKEFIINFLKEYLKGVED